VHDVLISYLRKSEDIVELRRADRAICYMSRHYWRRTDDRRRRGVELTVSIPHRCASSTAFRIGCGARGAGVSRTALREVLHATEAASEVASRPA
jgi:hypothetical protein